MDKKITVGMDISQLAHKGGVTTYTRNLSEELSKISGLEMVYFYSSLRIPYKGNLKNVKSFRMPPTIFEPLFNRIRKVSMEKFIGNVDIFHSSDWVQPPSKTKKVTTYHDVVPMKYPEWSTPEIVKVHKRRLELVEKEIDMVIAVSESTKKDLLEVSKIPAEKITVIYEGPTSDFKIRSEAEVEAFKKKYNLPDKFVLAMGGVGNRRNLGRIKEASKDYNLVIAGETIPWLDLDELELLYNSAKVLIYCSLYEGFGLPILDAFLCGVPVITSDISSMPEIGGDAPVYVDPLNVEDIKEKLKNVMDDKELRQEMKEKGLQRVKEFSWKKAASETYSVYKNLI